MKRISDYLDEVAKTTETGSDYAIAQTLGITKQAVSRYRKGHTPENPICRTIAQHLDIAPWEVIAAATAEREERADRPQEAAEWENLWRRVRRGGTAAIIALVVLGLNPQPAYASAAIGDGEGICIIRTARRLRRWLARFLYAPTSALA